MSSAADVAKQKIDTLKTQTANAVDNAMHTAQDFAADSATAVSDAVSHAYDSGVEIAEKATHEVELALDRTKDRLIQAVEEHPLAVGGVGLLIGAFVASCIPTTSAEASAFGEVSDGLKNHALNAMSEGIGVVTAAAGDVYDDAVAQTTKRGLTSDVVEDVIKRAGDKVQSAGHEAIDRLGAKAQSANQPGERK
jgi:methionine synthase II (cobalamin-independent)